MARKYDLISELYDRTCKTVVSNPQNWQAFLGGRRAETTSCAMTNSFLYMHSDLTQQRFLR